MPGELPSSPRFREGRAAGSSFGALGRAHAGPPPGPPSAQGPSLRIDEHLAAADMVRRADEALFLHPLDQPGGIVVADTQLALEVGGRRLLALRHDLDRLAEQLRLGIVLADRLALEHV